LKKEEEMRKTVLPIICLFLLSPLFFGCSATTQTMPLVTITGAPAPELDASQIPKSKQTVLGLYLTSAEAFAKWHMDPKIRILDCRTPEEYVFVGHAPMAVNIPSKFLTYQYNADHKAPVMKDNPDFMTTAAKILKPTDTIFVMCRSGGRSAKSVNILAGAGYTKVYNIIDGFEGDKIKDDGSYFNGKRIRNGWKNSGAPWTYSLDPDLMYLSEN
jgi:rhodanese-related sulfurtransferase